MLLKQEHRRKLGGLLMALGAFLGVWFFGLSTWAQFEANLFDADLSGDSQLPITCPRFIAPQESGQARITLTNPTGQEHSRFVRTHITHGGVTLMREETRLESVPAGGSIQMSWDFDSSDAVYGGTMIFVRSFAVGRAPLPSASATCGVYVIRTPFGLSGQDFMRAAFVLSLLMMLSGLALWRKNVPDTRRWRNLTLGFALLGASVAIGMALTLAGAWFLAAIALLVVFLLALSLFTPLVLS